MPLNNQSNIACFLLGPTGRDGVIPRGSERSTTKQAAQGQEPPTYRAVQRDGVMGVFRATGEKPTRGEGTASLILIPGDGRQRAGRQGASGAKDPGLGLAMEHMVRAVAGVVAHVVMGYPHLVDNRRS